MVSIGVPEKAKELIQHLKIENGDSLLFVDPDNTVYDALDLRRGVARTFANPATPFAFLDRIKEQDLSDLFQVLSKWSNAVYVPPKQEQAFLQGGTFLFHNGETRFAHYDPSTAAHASIDQVVELATQRISQAAS